MKNKISLPAIRKLLPFVLLLCLHVYDVKGQMNIIQTFAGTGYDEPFELNNANVIDHPYGITLDCNGRVYITQQEISTILQAGPGGALSHLSGKFIPGAINELWPGSGTGWPVVGSNAWFGWPAMPSIFPICPDVCTVTGFGGNGVACGSVFSQYGLPAGIVYDPVHDRLYIADTKNNCIRFIDNPATGGILNSLVIVGTALNINYPVMEDNTYSKVEPDCGEAFIGTGLAVDVAGLLYVADNGNNRVISVDPMTGAFALIAGAGAASYTGDGGPAIAATLNRPTGITISKKSGNIYITDYLNNAIRMVNPAGIITTLAGGNIAMNFNDGAAIGSMFAHPNSVAVDDKERVYVADLRNHRIRVIAGGNVCTIAGNGKTCDITGAIASDCPFVGWGPGVNFAQPLGDGANANTSLLFMPSDVKVDAWGNLFVVDMGHNKIRYVCHPESACTPAPTPEIVIHSPGDGLGIWCTMKHFSSEVFFCGCNPTYQWYVNGVAVPGETASTFDFTGWIVGDIVTCHVMPEANPYTGVGCANLLAETISNDITIYTTDPPITGPHVVCVGDTIVLSPAIAGGTWTSGSTGIATVDAAGVVTGVSAGTADITYTLPGGCIAVYHVTVPNNTVTGAHTICVGSTTSLIATSPGGTWASDNTTVATVSSAGVVTGVSVGTATISYTSPDGCETTFDVTVIVNEISGSDVLCLGGDIALTSAVGGGTWSSSDPTVATIDVSGTVHGLAAGTTTITYAGPGACITTFVVTVSESTITGSTVVCEGGAISLTASVPGGTWESSNPAVADVDASGTVTGITIGTATITYTAPGGCVTTFNIAVAQACICHYIKSGVSFSALTGTITSSPVPGYYFVPADIIIDATVDFTNSVIVIAPGVTITVASGAKLNIIHSHLFCCKDMWRGIVLSNMTTGGSGGPTGQLEITGNSDGTTLIEDATVAVEIDNLVPMPAYDPATAITDWLTLYSHGGTFNKNLIGVLIDNYAAALTPVGGAPVSMHPSYPFVVQNTVFTCRTFAKYTDKTLGLSYPFVWPSTNGTVAAGAFKAAITPATNYAPPFFITIGYAPTVCNNGTLSLAGIALLNVGITTGTWGSAQYSGVVTGAEYTMATTTDELDLYDNMNVGIYAQNSNVVSRNSDFMNMQGVRGQLPGAGDGIYSFRDATAAGDDLLYQLYVYGIDGSYNNKFWDCIVGVEAHDLYDVIGIHNAMRSSHNTSDLSAAKGRNGYYVVSSEFYETQINGNDIFNITNGINDINTPSGAGLSFMGQINIEHNNISAVDPAGSAPALGEYVYQAISVQNNPCTGPYVPWPLGYSNFQTNIEYNTLDHLYNGIYFSGDSWQIHYNTTVGNNISLVPLDPAFSPVSQRGVFYYYTDIVWAHDNTISGPGYNVPAPPSTTGSDYYTTPLLEGMRYEHVGKLQPYCNTISDINTGMIFSSFNSSVLWYDNIMQNNSYGFVLDGDFGWQGASGVNTIGNKWLPGGFWGGTNYDVYTAGTANPVLNKLYVNSLFLDEVPSNPGSDGTAVAYAPSISYFGTSDPAVPCTMMPYLPPPDVPVIMRPSGPATPEAAKDMNLLSVIPNPNDGIFTLEGHVTALQQSTSIAVEIVDMLGKVIFTEIAPVTNGEIKQKILIGNNIANGLYLVRVKNDKYSNVIRFTLNR